MCCRLEKVQQAQSALEIIRQDEPKTDLELNEMMATQFGPEWNDLGVAVCLLHVNAGVAQLYKNEAVMITIYFSVIFLLCFSSLTHFS